MRSLNVYIDRRRVGALHEGDDLWRFEYDVRWVEARDGYDLAPGLPRTRLNHADGGTNRPIQWFFDNLLPEERLRQAIEKEAGIRGEDAFALLEYLGAESAGSITLLPPDKALSDTAALQTLPDAQLSARIAGLPKQTLTAGAPKRMSLAGAQHKLLMAYLDGNLYEPEGATPSTHILKPSHPDADMYPASVVNEYVTMRVAHQVGLNVPAVHLRYVPEPVYIIDRFDRTVKKLAPSADGTPRIDVERLHIIDACQLLNRPRTFKHSGASLEALRDIIKATTNKLHTRTALFRWLVFNVLMANDDCHLKNLSFFMAPDGIKLAPHYDLLATGAYYTRAFADEKATWPNVSMAIALPGARTFGEVTGESILSAGRELGLAAPTAQRILRELTDRLPKALEHEIDELEKRHAALAPEAEVNKGSESRFMRVLDNIVVHDILARARE